MNESGRREICCIEPSGKGATGSRNNDGDRALVRGGTLHRVANLIDHRERESVELLGPPYRGD